MQLTADPDFQAAIKYAKAIAEANGQPELTPQLVLAGFLAYLTRESGIEESALLERVPSLKDASCRVNIPDELDLAGASEKRLPVSMALKQFLGGKYGKVLDFLDQLLEDAVPDDPADQEIFRSILARASAWSRRQKDSTSDLSVEVLGAAAYYAYLAGEFAGKAFLEVHISMYRKPLEAMIAENGWSPELFARDGIQRDDVIEWQRHIHHAVDHDGRRLKCRLHAALIRPGRLQLRDV